jgi:dienelactone hydrolase
VGTLTIPKDVNQPLPGVVLITGSSPQNRDHSTADHPEYRLFRQIADALSRRGIVVLRMDDRGCGCSGGGPLKSATTAQRADDIRSGISYLKGRKEIFGNRIGLIGLSEGGIIASLIFDSFIYQKQLVQPQMLLVQLVPQYCYVLYLPL